VDVRDLPKSHSVTAHIPACRYLGRQRCHSRFAGALRRCVLLAGVLVTVGCTTGDAHVARCPVTRVLEDPAQLTRFKPGQGRDITDIEFDAAFAELAGTCEIDDEEIAVELKVLIVANRGTANASRQASFVFFIAVVDQDRNVMIHDGKALRKGFEGQVEFPGNQTRVTYTDEFELTIPMKSGQSASDFFIFFGFELTRGELEYNRNRLRR
jgi:hypothetical protein